MHQYGRRRKMKSGYCFILLTVLQFSGYISYAIGTRITIEDNAYSNILVAISPDVPKNEAETIIDNIQVNYNSSSRYRVFHRN